MRMPYDVFHTGEVIYDIRADFARNMDHLLIPVIVSFNI